MSDPSAPPFEPEPAPSPAPDEPAPDEFTDFERSFLDTIGQRYTSDGDTIQPPADADSGPGPDEPDEGREPSESEQPDESEATAGGDGQPPSVFTLSGVDYTADQMAQAIQVRDYFAQLPPSYIQAIDALVSGQFHLEPNQSAPVQPPSSPSTPSPPPVSSPDPYAGGEWGADPTVAQLNQLQTELNELRSVVQNTLPTVVNRQHQDDYNNRLTEITQASEAFQSQYSLTEDQMRALEANIVQAQILPALQNRHQSLKGGMTAALEQMFWSTPDLRDPYLQKVQASRQAETTAQEADTLRKQQLTALSASGGSAPRREPVPSTPEDRWAAVAAEIASSMNGSGTIQ